MFRTQQSLMRAQQRALRFMSAFAREVPMAPADPILSLKALIRQVRVAGGAVMVAVAAHALLTPPLCFVRRTRRHGLSTWASARIATTLAG
jgi:hypothetical protein